MNVEVEMLSAGQATAFSIEECQTRIRSNIDSGLRDLYKLSFLLLEDINIKKLAG